MSREKPWCEQVYPWLRANLGPRCLAPLTGTDARALAAAVQLIALYNQCDSGDERAVLGAFRAAVLCMQPSTRELAYHAIAQQCEWDTRAALWCAADLPVPMVVRRCAHEPRPPVQTMEGAFSS